MAGGSPSVARARSRARAGSARREARRDAATRRAAGRTMVAFERGARPLDGRWRVRLRVRATLCRQRGEPHVRDKAGRTPTVTTATPGPRSSADRAKPSKRGVAFFFERLRGRDWRKGRARALLITKKKLITRSTRRKASSSRLCSPAHSAISRGGTPPALPRATPVCPRFSRSATR